MEFLHNLIVPDSILFCTTIFGLVLLSAGLVCAIQCASAYNDIKHRAGKVIALCLVASLGMMMCISSIVLISTKPCPNCNERVTSSYCTSCGTPIPEEARPTCPECNEECQTPYCGNCGAAVNSTD